MPYICHLTVFFMSKFYITTAIAYVNGAPHLGHALEFVQADAISRYRKAQGDEVFFLTGTDEHGIKVYEKATEMGRDVREFVDENAEKFIAIDKMLNVKYDGFVRTSSEAHKKGAQKIWKAMSDKGDIYKGSYEGRYCKGCEAFLTERDIDENGHCLIHKKSPDLVREENYFFRLSKYSDEIKRLIEKDEVKIIPESRKNEILSIIGEGLKDVSFSRPVSELPWGISVPGDDSHVMYVWCDALSNYISAIGYSACVEDCEEGRALFEKFWPADVHLIGKDILRFHAGVWIGMLLSAGMELPRKIAVHGFVTSRGEKMSKSLGNVVDPVYYIEKYGYEMIRYFLLREIPTLDDGDFSHNRFIEVINSELANNLGNLVNRVIMMTERFVGKIPEKVEIAENIPGANSPSAVLMKIKKSLDMYELKFEAFDIKGACEVILDLSDFANKYIDQTKPWAMAKEEAQLVAEGEKFISDLPDTMGQLLEMLYAISKMLLPILPESAIKIAKMLHVTEDDLVRTYEWGRLKAGEKIEKGEILFRELMR